jgi:hypothetical protein
MANVQKDQICSRKLNFFPTQLTRQISVFSIFLRYLSSIPCFIFHCSFFSLLFLFQLAFLESPSAILWLHEDKDTLYFSLTAQHFHSHWHKGIKVQCLLHFNPTLQYTGSHLEYMINAIEQNESSKINNLTSRKYITS